MEKTFKAIVNDTYQYQLDSDDNYSLDSISNSDNSFHILHHNQSIIAQVVNSDFLNRTYIIKVNANLYTVKLENELDALIEKMGLSLGENAVENEIKAPMPGLIIDISVTEGQTVKEGEYLCVLEAMKMENTLMASRGGVIKSIAVAKGDTVEKGALLIEFEPQL